MSRPAETSGRCYCGRCSLTTTSAPLSSSFCHCIDCRRLTGAPVAAFAAFPEADVQIVPAELAPVIHPSGVQRWFCPSCGSPLAARFPYLPGQVFVPLGILDQADNLRPTLHCYRASALSWMRSEDGIARSDGSARADLSAARKALRS